MTSRGIYALYARHPAGAEHAEQVLSWCDAVGIRNITVFICSTENLQHRDGAEAAYLMRVIEEVVLTRLAQREARCGRHHCSPVYFPGKLTP